MSSSGWRLLASVLGLLSIVGASDTTEHCDSPMKVAVLGATGGVGAHVVKIALEQGHQVLAMARDPSKIPATHSSLTSVKIDLADRNADTLATAIKGMQIYQRSCRLLDRLPMLT